jgi:hypothetical protein
VSAGAVPTAATPPPQPSPGGESVEVAGAFARVALREPFQLETT